MSFWDNMKSIAYYGKIIVNIIMLIKKLVWTFAGDEERDGRLKKSVCCSYSLGIMLLLVRQSNNMNMYEKYANKLVDLSEKGWYWSLGRFFYPVTNVDVTYYVTLIRPYIR